MRIATPAAECAEAAPLSAEALRELALHATRLADRRARDSAWSTSHALGLVELAAAVNRDDLDRAVRLLREALVAEPELDVFRTDLAAALLVRYGTQRHVLDLLEAVELTTPLVTAERPAAAACWNHIVGLAWLAARDQAMQTRERCTSSCRAEACRMPVLVDDAPIMASDTHALTHDERWTDASWDHAVDVLLPEWARSRRLGDSVSERRMDEALRRIDERLRRRAADSSIGRALAEASRWPSSTTEGARRLRAFELHGEARRIDRDADSLILDRLLDSVRVTTTPDDELRRWVEHLDANRALTRGRAREALTRYAALIAQRPDAHGVTGGRLRFNVALATMALGDQLAALDAIERNGADCLAAARNECALAAFAMASGVAALVGDEERTLRNAEAALSASVAPFGRWRWTLMSRLRQLAEGQGWTAVAGVLQLEAVSVAAALQRPDLQVQDLVLHARALARAGDTINLRADLEQLRPLIRFRLGDEDRRFHLADLAHLEGEYLLAARQPGATVWLDSATRLMASDTNLSRQLRPALSQARADVVEGDTARGLHRLDSLLQILTARSVSATHFARQRLIDDARSVGDVAAPVLRRRRDAAALLAALSGAPFAGASLPVGSADRTRLDLALRRLGDTVLVWSRRDDAWHVRAVQLPAHRLGTAGSSRDSATLAELYELLLAPEVAGAREAASQLRIDARGDLADVPWAALYDRRSRQFLVERFAVWQTEDIRLDPGPAQPIPRAREGGRRVLIVDAAPANGRRALPGAQAEVQRLGRLWGTAADAVPAAVGADAVLARFAAYDLVHYAGHAVLDARRPENSHLLLAGDAEERITGSTLAALRLPNTALVVLAACDTRAAAAQGRSDGRVGSARGGGLQSLAHALRAAGARHVLGAAWPIDDAATAVLMERFHAALRDGQPVAVALRIAQLESLRSPDPALRSPRVWAAFQLLGS